MPRPIDVFLIAGQSNASGAGNKDESPLVGPHCLQFHGGVLSRANDPVGGAKTGSAWPMFAQTWYSATRRPVLLIPCGAGNTASCTLSEDVPSGAGHWGVEGTHLLPALAKVAAGIAAAQAAGYEPEFVGTLWCQGETDIRAYREGRITTTQYKAALLTIVTTIKAQHPDGGFFIFRTGTSANEDHPYAVIRLSQELFAGANQREHNTRVVFRGATEFLTAGLMQPASNHYTQTGYNVMGHMGALGVLHNGQANRLCYVEPIYPATTRSQFATD